MNPADRFRNPTSQECVDRYTEEPATTLNRKAYNFVYKAEYSGELRNKITMLGRDSFEKILPFLVNEQICVALEMEMYDNTAEQNIPTETQGILKFASAIGINKDYIFTLYKEYLKSFMR